MGEGERDTFTLEESIWLIATPIRGSDAVVVLVSAKVICYSTIYHRQSSSLFSSIRTHFLCKKRRIFWRINISLFSLSFFSLCMSVCPSICLSLSLYKQIGTNICIYLSFSLSLSISLSLSLFLFLLVCLSVLAEIYLFFFSLSFAYLSNFLSSTVCFRDLAKLNLPMVVRF